MGSLSVAWVVDSFPHCSVICHSANPPGFRTQRKQGIISAKLGILAQEQGILPSTPEIIAADVFGTNNGIFFKLQMVGPVRSGTNSGQAACTSQSPFQYVTPGNIHPSGGQAPTHQV